jgi:hypothetical protein
VHQPRRGRHAQATVPAAGENEPVPPAELIHKLK